MTPSTQGLTPVDWVFICLYSFGTIGLGYYYSRRQASTSEYFTGGGHMHPTLIGISLFATLLSTISYLSIPGEAIGKGPVWMLNLVAFPVVYLIVGYVIIPVYMRHRVTSAYAADDLAAIEEAADHLQMTVPEFQRAGVWVVAFLLGLSNSDPDPIDPPEAVGPKKVTTAYFAAAGDQQALEQVAAGFSLTGAQAQQVSTTVLVFLVGLAKAAGR